MKRARATVAVEKSGRKSARDLIPDEVHSRTASGVRVWAAVLINDVETMQRAKEDGTISKADRLVDDVRHALGVLCANWQRA